MGALIQAHKKYVALAASDSKPTITGVGVPEIPERPEKNLTYVLEEMAAIETAVGKDQFSALIGEKATTENVFSTLSTNDLWIHLACHGEQDPDDPLMSHLLLYDGDLDLERILGAYLPRAQFAFLSACQTATGDAVLMNESMHLSGGLLFAGFCGVVGTMWSVADVDCPPLAQIMYRRLFQKDKTPDVARAANALHLAVRAMRKKGLSFQRWANFVHMGV